MSTDIATVSIVTAPATVAFSSIDVILCPSDNRVAKLFELESHVFESHAFRKVYENLTIYLNAIINWLPTATEDQKITFAHSMFDVIIPDMRKMGNMEDIYTLYKIFEKDSTSPLKVLMDYYDADECEWVLEELSEKLVKKLYGKH